MTTEGVDCGAGPIVGGMECGLDAGAYVVREVSVVESIEWWRLRGYEPMERRLDNDKRDVEVHRQLLQAVSSPARAR